MLAGLVIYKIVAVELGADAIGQLGQFISLISIIIILSTAGISSGVTKIVAQNKNNQQQLKEVINTALVIIIFFLFFILTILSISVNYIFEEIFYIQNTVKWFKYYFLASIILIASSQFMLSIINGLKNTKVYSLTISIGTIVSMLIAYPMVKFFGLYGAFTTLLFNYIIQSLYLLYFFRKTILKNNLFLTFNFSRKFLKQYANYAFMFIVTAIIAPSVQIAIRNMVGDNFSMVEVGYWEALMKLSNLYVAVVMVFLSVYLLPYLSEKDDKEMVLAVISFIKVLSIFLIVWFIIIYFYKVYIIKILYSDEFLIVTNYIYIQQIGDFFKLISYTIGYFIIVKMWTKTVILLQVFNAAVFILAGEYFIYNSNNFHGASIAYSVAFFIHFIVNIIIFYNFKKKAFS